MSKMATQSSAQAQLLCVMLEKIAQLRAMLKKTSSCKKQAETFNKMTSVSRMTTMSKVIDKI